MVGIFEPIEDYKPGETVYVQMPDYIGWEVKQARFVGLVANPSERVLQRLKLDPTKLHKLARVDFGEGYEDTVPLPRVSRINVFQL